MTSALEKQFGVNKLETRSNTFENPVFWVQQEYLKKVSKLLEEAWINKKAVPETIQVAINKWKEKIENNMIDILKRHNKERSIAIGAVNDDNYQQKNVA